MDMQCLFHRNPNESGNEAKDLMFLPCVEIWSPPLVEDEDSMFQEIYG